VDPVAEDMAKVTTKACFEDCDVNKDGKLELSEFKKWWHESM